MVLSLGLTGKLCSKPLNAHSLSSVVHPAEIFPRKISQSKVVQSLIECTSLIGKDIMQDSKIFPGSIIKINQLEKNRDSCANLQSMKNIAFHQ